MFDRWDEDDEDEDEYVAAPPPPMMTWDGEDQVESVYEMQGRWIGHQRDMDYRYVDPTPAVVPIGRPRARRAQLALRAARDAWRRAA